ncbi:bifunctional [glutamine synthetase] adenylyltransferase/[glutamine synthetase]-adenylyl-L-tyrosine phosphorylase [Roseovarius dicentrarchi]|uniref:bifunctional [glutamine synthetase] adenylyltransferase/[glutamine synthetase]-adenylyl-L-tyrosine phosphorylase n=1 Tax=Roseovarius dicentrarchi TaxID=2250573 RepID=UPI000DEBD1BB|nr:bifunctional [glutamine synthetase] adenylyltransferase/[glutamine synthetase]-adenylyl-L-tyrosine phosphorylase [Roseovarius dicentrarchi]
MEFARRITRLPRPYQADHAEEAQARFPTLGGDLRELIGNTAGCSPYLRQLMQSEAEWLPGALDAPEDALAALMQDVRAIEGDPSNPLRQAKRRVALLLGLADLAGVWPLEMVTQALTDFADLACAAALRHAVGNEIRRGKLPGMTEDDLRDGAGMVVLAMGKMGAGELNYSSDIDLICLYDETRFDADANHEARAGFVRATRRMAAILGENTAEGYVFRTDLRLRPDPGVTPVCMSMAAAERYYESLGRTWERAAYIKARPCAGDFAAGHRFLDTLTPFVWRRHLDFAAIEDAHNMRLRIRAHKGLGADLGGPLDLMGHNMKLGRGGIREIEFFTQTRQLIVGGRDPSLRMRGTVEGLEGLAEKDWIPPGVAGDLAAHYRFHREVEHRLQMLRDQQTHDLPETDEGMARLAAFMGRDAADLKDELLSRLTAVDGVIERFFKPEGDDAAAADAEQGAWLDEKVIARWPTYPALRSDRAGQIFRRLRPDILSRLSRTSHPEEALLAFDGFLAGLPAGVQVFSLFEANPQLLDLLVDIAGTAPALARYLSRNAAVLDAVIAGDFFAAWPGRVALRADLTARLAREGDYEARLIAARHWRREWHFRIGVHHLRGLIDAATSARHYADLAEAVLSSLWPEVVHEFSAKHGPPPGRGACLLGMGSLGVRALNAASDLDLIVIYDADGAEASEGRRPLASGAYYARLTQAMISALTVQMAGGRLYEVDMRLRPSGNQGPVATSLAAFRDYQQTRAWGWEHLALTRARSVAGDPALGAEIEAFRVSLIAGIAARTDAPARLAAAVSDMRARIAASKAPDGPLDAKMGPGRLQDVQLIAQAATLISGTARQGTQAGLGAGTALGWWTADEARQLSQAAALCREVHMAARLLGDAALDADHLGAGARAFVLREAGKADIPALVSALAAASNAAAAIIDTALARAGAGQTIPNTAEQEGAP